MAACSTNACASRGILASRSQGLRGHDARPGGQAGAQASHGGDIKPSPHTQASRRPIDLNRSKSPMPRHRPYALLQAGAVLLFSACERTKTSPFAARVCRADTAISGIQWRLVVRGVRGHSLSWPDVHRVVWRFAARAFRAAARAPAHLLPSSSTSRLNTTGSLQPSTPHHRRLIPYDTAKATSGIWASIPPA